MTKLFDKYYYVVYFKDWVRPQLYPVYFLSKPAAKRAIVSTIPKRNRAFYEIVKGSKLRDFDFNYLFKLGTMGKFTKYQYPKELDTPKKRQDFRTIMRRRLRRMGMLTPIKGKYDVRKTKPQGRLIKNRQKIANSPNTIALAFRLERKPIYTYYIILEKHISKQKKVLFEVDTLRVDMKNKTIKRQIIKVRNTDVIIPFLITEIIKMYGKEILDRCRAEGLRLDHYKQKILLKRVCEGLPDTHG